MCASIFHSNFSSHISPPFFTTVRATNWADSVPQSPESGGRDFTVWLLLCDWGPGSVTRQPTTLRPQHVNSATPDNGRERLENSQKSLILGETAFTKSPLIPSCIFHRYQLFVQLACSWETFFVFSHYVCSMIRQSDTICVWGDSQGITIISNLPHKHDKVQIAQSGLRKPIIWQQIEFGYLQKKLKLSYLACYSCLYIKLINYIFDSI